MERKILQIFLASPSGLESERDIVRNVARRHNELFSKRLGVQIEIIGWEDLVPNPSRPQERINVELDTASVFLGILGSRWGSGTGQYSSGFEEEFVRSKIRFERTSSPDIRLFFKSVDSTDPGPQLVQVLDFKKKIEEEKKYFFKSFSNLE